MPVIITKNSSSAGAVPSSGQLVRGELAVNVTDRKLYTLNASNNVVLLSSGEITLTTTGTSGAATLVSNALNIPIYGNGTVTSLSVASANGFAGTVATATTTPAITLTTSVTGIIKGNGGGLFAAVANSDFQSPVSLTTLNTSGAATFSSNVFNIPQYQGVISLTTTGTSGAATFSSNTLNIPNYAVAVAATPTALGLVFGATGSGASANTSLGNNAAINAAATSAVAVGVGSTIGSGGASGTAVGGGSSVTGASGTAIGSSSSSVGTGAAFGSGSNVLATGAAALGYNADVQATGTSGLSIGNAASNSAPSGIAIGASANVGATSNNGIAIGASATILTSNPGAIAIGNGTGANNSAVAIGTSASALALNAIALGANTSASASDTISIGRSNNAAVTRSILIGNQINGSNGTMIVLSTQSTAFTPLNAGVFINAPRNSTNTASLSGGSVQCDPNTKEIFYTTESFSAYGVNFQRQAAATAFSAAATVTAAQLATGIFTCTGASTYALTMPSGASIDSQFPILATNSITNASFDLAIINNSTTVAVTITAGSGTTLGSGQTSIAASSSALFRFRRTGTSAYVYYRIA
jgi:hypothetical protein